jgi:hypothetical protein
MQWTPGRSFDKVRFALNAAASPTAAQSTALLPAAQTDAISDASGGNNIAWDAAVLPGIYSAPDGSTLEIQQLANGKTGFSLMAISPNGNTGEAAGTLTVEGEVFTYRDAEFDCLLTFRIAENGIAVTQKGLCGFGMNVSAEGNYLKQAS